MSTALFGGFTRQRYDPTGLMPRGSLKMSLNSLVHSAKYECSSLRGYNRFPISFISLIGSILDITLLVALDWYSYPKSRALSTVMNRNSLRSRTYVHTLLHRPGSKARGEVDSCMHGGVSSPKVLLIVDMQAQNSSSASAPIISMSQFMRHGWLSLSVN